MSSNTASIVIGTASTNASHAADLGKLIFIEGKGYKLCKAAATIATAAGRGLVTAFSSGLPTWNVDLAAAAVTDHVVFVPENQVGSTGTTSLISGDYFYAQVSGPAYLLAADTTSVKANGQGIQVSSLGRVSALSVVTVASLILAPGNTIKMTNTAAVSAAGTATTGFLSGLI